MPAAVSSPTPPVLVKLGAGQVAGLRPFLDWVPDPRARRGRWYSLTAILLICACACACACAAVSGTRSVDEAAEWAARAPDTVLTAVGVRRHPLRWRRATFRNLAIGLLKTPGAVNIAKAIRASAAGPNGPSRSWASPTTRKFGKLDQTLST